MQVVVLMGIQGAGKSTFYQQRFADTHVRINLDMLRTRHREKTLFEACLACGQSVVIDNTNPTAADRARYLPQARAVGAEVLGYFLAIGPSEATSRNAERTEGRRVPDRAIYGTARRLERPSLSEGFDALFFVTSTDRGGFAVEDWNDEIHRT